MSETTAAPREPGGDPLVVRHLPERGRSSHRAVVVYACCTCCCCLHSVGALVGAFVGGGLKRPVADPGFDPNRRIPMVHWLFDRLPRTQWIFWSSVVGVVTVTVPVLALVLGSGGLGGGLSGVGDGFLVSAIVHALLGPVVPLLAWVVSLVRLAWRSERAAAPEEFWTLHKAMLWSLVGALAGVVLMLLLLLPLFAMR